ncbi:helix-turn-helix domain-containing protein [Pseudomonas putida]|uniref:GlxA family transcriptional regulator n=1 Tax=Pseudomonas putida TaxID=303 RepID=UPI00226F53C6|nr:helix-turn-helix domain-containing protein [Pseudomonas putida]WAC00532.1 helix-turn-helix domain-containing protein [Pseudomonas putida]
MSDQASSERRVHIVIYPGFKSIEAVGALTVFDYANIRQAAEGLPAAYSLHLVAPQPGLVGSDTLVTLQADDLRSSPRPHTALVVGARDIGTAIVEQRLIVDWCRQAASRIERLVGVCSGAFFLAQAGVVDGLNVTTHWSVASKLASDFPLVNVDSDAIFIEQGRIWTCAGVSAAIDLSLALVEQDLGQEMALQIARELVVFLKRPGGQSQFSQHLDSQMTPHSAIRRLRLWILQNLDRPLSLELLAERANMSSRNLRRLFHRESGCSPLVFIERARMEKARRLLVDEDTALKRIADQCGFGSEEQMRRVFQRNLKLTPRRYREQSRAQ